MSEAGAIADLGELQGDVLLYGGPYSNLQATRALLAEADRMGIPPRRRICTGDVIGYCADPLECVAAVRDAGGAVVAGNVERQIAANGSDCGCGFEPGSACDVLARGWYPAARAAVAGARGVRDWCVRLPSVIRLTHEGRRWAAIHGGVGDIARFVWPTAPEAVFASEVAALRRLVGPVEGVIAGHCGVAFAREVAGVLWLNAGAAGLPPHDGRPMTRFVVLGPRGPVIHRLAYDHAGARAAMERAGLTQGYEIALETGIWPSEEVLPPAMRRGGAGGLSVPADGGRAPGS